MPIELITPSRGARLAQRAASDERQMIGKATCLALLHDSFPDARISLMSLRALPLALLLAATALVGAPARAIRTLDEKAASMIRAGADIYVRRWKQYATGLMRIG